MIISKHNSTRAKDAEFLVAPRGRCISCGHSSGPKFLLTKLRDSSDVLRNNIVPYGFERVSTELEIENAESEIDQLGEEIDALERKIDSLRKRHIALQKFTTQKKSLLAPIRKLPQDVLQYLFLECQWHLEEDAPGYISVCNPRAFIRIITQVCAHWRSVALSCPALWSRILIKEVDDEAIYTFDDDIVGPFVEKCISLSREAPLHIDTWSDCPESLFADRCVKTIAEAAYRWEVIMIADGVLFENIMAQIPAHLIFDQLKDLRIWRSCQAIQLNPSPVLTRLYVNNTRNAISLQAAPLLSHLETRDLKNPDAFFKSDCPWNQITHFRSYKNHYSEEQLAVILQMMPNLKFFALIGDTKMIECITLSQLLILRIGDRWFDPRHSFYAKSLEVFKTPCLKTLHVNAEMAPSTIIQFLERSDCVLMYLMLYRVSLAEEWKAKRLRRLIKIHLHQPDSINQDIHWLTRKCNTSGHGYEVHPSLLPALKILEITSIPPESKSVLKDLIAMLISRLPPIQDPVNATDTNTNRRISYLKSVSISLSWKLDRNDENFLRRFIRSDMVSKSGVQISIKHMVSEYDSKYIVRDGVEYMSDEEDGDSNETESDEEEQEQEEGESEEDEEESNEDQSEEVDEEEYGEGDTEDSDSD
ncbi:hypothetical protein BDQ17DRAFT_1279524 [Cyathus striatus]|nr:hypothetical protein BDQ17DRAFT_1279524 [Cyathus striatus]